MYGRMNREEGGGDGSRRMSKEKAKDREGEGGCH